MGVVHQRLTADEAAQYHSLSAPIIDTHLDKEATALIGTVVNSNAAFNLPELGYITATREHVVGLHIGAK